MSNFPLIIFFIAQQYCSRRSHANNFEREVDLALVKARRTSLLALHLLVGLNALAGGYFGLSGAPQVPIDWLDGSPFQSYFIPSLILLFVVGGSQFLAAFFLFRKSPSSLKLSKLAGAILLVWIIVQVSIIGYVSWLQPAIAMIAGVNFLLASWMHRR